MIRRRLAGLVLFAGWAVGLSGGASSAAQGAPPAVAADAPRTRGATPDLGDEGRRYYKATAAVIVGIDQYPGGASGLNALEFAVNDARELRDVLRDEFGYAEQRIRFLTDAAATRQAVEEAFQVWLPKLGLQADDAVLFFFAGHGLIDEQTQEGYLAAADSRSTPLSSCVPVAWIRDRLAELPCRHKLVVLDSCYSGSLFQVEGRAAAAKAAPVGGPKASRGPAEATRGSARLRASRVPLEDANLDYYLTHPAFLGMSAGRITPVADGTGKGRHSRFTAPLLAELRDRADSRRHADYIFTFRQLAARIEARVANAPGSQQIPDYGRLAPGDGDFLFRPTVRRLPESVVQKLDAHSRLVRLHELNGLRLIEEGDWLRSLLWFTEAIRRDEAGKLDDDLRDLPEWVAEYDQRTYVDRVHLGHVSNRCPPLLHTLICDGSVRSAEFRGDGQRLLTAAAGVVRQWDLGTGDPLGQPLKVRGKTNVRAAYSPDGKRFVTAHGLDDDTTLQLWDSEAGGPLSEPVLIEGSIQQLAFSPDGQRIAVRLRLPPTFGQVRLFDGTTFQAVGQPIQAEPANPAGQANGTGAGLEALQQMLARVNPAVHVAFSPDGRKLVSTWQNGAVLMTDAATGQRAGPAIFHKLVVNQAAFSPDGRRLATASGDHTAGVWDVATGKAVTPPLRHDSNVLCVRFGNDGRWLATATARTPLGVGLRSAEARIWDAGSGEASGPPLRHQDDIVALEFGPDGRQLLTVSKDHTARLWDPVSGRPLTPGLRHAAELTGAQFSPDGRRVLTASQDETVRLWDIGSVAEEAARQPSQSLLIAISDDGERLAYFDLQAARLRIVDGPREDPVVTLEGNADAATRTAFSPDKTRLLIASLVPAMSAAGVRLWDLPAQKSLVLEHPDATGLFHVEFSRDGKLAVTVGMYMKGTLLASETWGEARVWDVATGKLLKGAPLKHPVNPLSCASFSPDGQRLVTASLDGTIRIWDLKTQQSVVGPMNHLLATVVKFSPDGTRLASGDNSDGWVHVWDAATGAPVGERWLAGGKVKGLTFDPVGDRLLTYTEEGTARVWSVATGRPVTPPMRHGGPINDACFDASGKLVLTAAFDQTARAWHAATGVPATPPLQHPLTHVFRVVAGTKPGLVYTTDRVRRYAWNVAPEERPVEELSLSYDWLAASRLDASGDVVELPWVQAPEHLEALMTAHPKNWSLHFRRGLIHMEKEEWEAARDQFSQALALGSDDQDVWEHRGLAEANLGHVEKALADFGRAVERGGRSIGLLRGRGDAFRQRGEFAQAAKCYDEVLTQFALRWQDWHARGFCYASLGEWKKALADYQKALEIEGNEPSLHYQMSMLYLAQGDAASYHQACGKLRAQFAAAASPETAYWIVWACSLDAQGRVDESLLELARKCASGADAANPTRLTALGAILYRAGQFDEAVTTLSKAVAAFPAGKSAPAGAGQLLSPSYASLYLAMAHARKQEAAEARSWLTQARTAAKKDLQPDPGTPPTPWNRLLTVKRLLQEAETVVAAGEKQ